MKRVTGLAAVCAVLAVPGLVSYAGLVRAEQVNATFNSVSPSRSASFSTNSGSNYTGTVAGVFNFTGGSGDGLDLAPIGNEQFVGFCIDLADEIRYNETWTWDVIDLAQAPDPINDNFMGATKAGDLSRMLATYLPDFSTASTLSADQAAGLQLAIWEIVWETSDSTYSLSSGNARFTSDADAINLANTYLDSSQWKGTGLTNLKALSLPSGTGTTPQVQDFVVQVVPIPAAAWLFGSALFGAVAIGRRKAKVKA